MTKKSVLSRAVVGAALVVSLGAAPRAVACSLCRCGDPAFTLVGSQIFSPVRWRFGFDTERFSKDQVAEPHHDEREGDAGAALREEEVEQRYTFSATYSAGRRLTLVARVPFARRTITVGGESERLSGLSDPELLVHYRVARSARPGSWLALTAGVRSGWGANDKTLGRERAEEHLQPGSGAAGATAGAAFATLLGAETSLFGSLNGRINGRNDAGYRYGGALLANLALERRLAGRVNGIVELNYRWAARDEIVAGERDENSGGSVLYVSPRVLLQVDPRQNLWLRLGAQIPVAKGLYGDQDEKVNLLAGLTVRF